jgi:polar amino acid transport system substrate-binding protein
MVPTTPDPRVTQIVQAGQIRLALFLPQYTKDRASGELNGLGMGYVAMAMGRELASRLGIELRLIEHPTPPSAIACIKSGACDLGFLGIEPSRVAEIDFSPPVVQFDYTFLVPDSSSMSSSADADRPGTRIAVVSNHASTLALSRLVKHANLIGSDLPDDAFGLLHDGRVDALAAPREQLVDYALTLPGSRVLADGYGVNNVGIAVAKGRAGWLAFVSEFVDDAKTSGLIEDIIGRGHLHGFGVAP